LKKNNIHYQRTFEQFSLIIIIFLLSACNTPVRQHEIKEPSEINPDQIVTVRDIPQSHKQFIARFLPKIRTANNNILHKRNQILDLQSDLRSNSSLSDAQLRELNGYLSSFRLDTLATEPSPAKADLNEAITKLLDRADIIPIKLVMAQAILESGWGSSSFAKDGNNYFGVHCYTEGCGVKPAGNDNANFYVKTYPSVIAGIEDYLWILNTGDAYRGLRETRAELRSKNLALNPIDLAQGLSRYSAKGEDYVTMVSNIISDYIPKNVNELL
jgi:Bax protein